MHGGGDHYWHCKYSSVPTVGMVITDTIYSSVPTVEMAITDIIFSSVPTVKVFIIGTVNIIVFLRWR